MKVKTKNILTGTVLAVFVSLLALFIVVAPKDATTVSAASTPKYAVVFDYSATYTYGSGAGTSQHPSSGKGVYSASFSYGANRTIQTLSVVMYGNSASGTGTFENGNYIGASDITVEIISSVKMTVNIKDASGKSVGSGSKQATANSLSEGTYTVAISGSGGGPINSRAGWAYGFSGTFEFKIDGNAPTINGASTSKTGVYKNSSFTVTASDSSSGVKAVYMKAPNNNTFYSVGGNSTTVNKGSANGFIMLLRRLRRLAQRAVIQLIPVRDAAILTKIILRAHTGITTNRLFSPQLARNTAERFLPVSFAATPITKATVLFLPGITILTKL